MNHELLFRLRCSYSGENNIFILSLGGVGWHSHTAVGSKITKRAQTREIFLQSHMTAGSFFSFFFFRFGAVHTVSLHSAKSQ